MYDKDTASHCNILQHNETQRNTLQHTATTHLHTSPARLWQCTIKWIFLLPSAVLASFPKLHHINTYTYTYMYMCMSIHIHIHTCTCVWVYISYTHTWIHINKKIFIYIYTIHLGIHTYIQTCINVHCMITWILDLASAVLATFPKLRVLFFDVVFF